MADKFDFQAIYKIDKDGERLWWLRLENGQLVTIGSDRVCLFPSLHSDLSKDAIGVIERAATKGDETNAAEEQPTEPQRLL